MNKDFVEMFINQIEDLMRASDKEEYVQDEAGMYLKVLYLEHLISEARELIKYGESKIALENMLENLNEVSISLDESVLELARRAFEDQATSYMEQLSNNLVTHK